MEIYTLVGKSGTGKSFHAMNLCKKYGIEAIIDDGLFIYKNTLVEGESAKRAGTKIGAVKRALFHDDEHKEKVVSAIKKKNPRSILVLGTSESMVDKIIDRLMLPKVPEDSLRRIKIEDITSKDERDMARQQRDLYGKHVIPAPSLQLKHNFAGYFMDPLRFFRGKDQGVASERTVVRPTYSYLGQYFVSEKVIDDIIRCVGKSLEPIGRVIHIGHVPRPEEYKLMIAIRVKEGYDLWKSAIEFQEMIEEAVENMTAFNVARIDIEIRGII